LEIEKKKGKEAGTILSSEGSLTVINGVQKRKEKDFKGYSQGP